MDEQLEPTSPVVVRHPTSYHFRFKHGGWAIFTIDDEVGTFQIQSDWGDYAHRWNPAHLGDSTPTLTSFIAKGDVHYLVDKLHYGKERERFDGKETARHLRHLLTEQVEDGRLNETKAEVLTSDANELRHANNEHEAMEVASEGLKERFEPLYEHFARTPTPGFVFLRDKLLPLFVTHLREQKEPEPAKPVDERAIDLGA